MKINFIITLILLFVNLLSYLLMYLDKQKARKRHNRIHESTLWIVAFSFGGLGATLGMKKFRHKTKHSSFKFGFPLLAIIQLVLIIYLFREIHLGINAMSFIGWF